MNDLNKKTELDADQIHRIQTVLAHKAHDWFLSGGRVCDGMEVFRTQEEGIFVLRDIETGVELGMRKEVKNGGVMTHLSFFAMQD